MQEKVIIAISFAVKLLLVMTALPALGLVSLSGGLGTGVLATFGVHALPLLAMILCLPVVQVIAVAVEAASFFGGRYGEVLGKFAAGTVVESIAIGAVAGLLPGLELIGFWSTVCAGALFGFIDVILDAA